MSKDFLPEVVFCLLFIFINVNLKKYEIDKNQEVKIKGHIVHS